MSQKDSTDLFPKDSITPLKKDLNYKKEDTIIKKIQVFESFNFPSNYDSQYRLLLHKVRKVYPLALRAAEIVDSLDNEIEYAKNRRKQRKVTRNTQKELKEDFKFLLKDMYISEGQILTKLIYRETGMTVKELLRKYKSGIEVFAYSGIASIFEQDLDAVYKPDSEDMVIESIIQDILTEKIRFDPNFKTLSQEQYKEKRKQEKTSKKKRKQKAREAKRKQKKKQEN